MKKRRARNAARDARAFWDTFKKRVGLPPSEEPHRYWSPALGHFCNLRPCDLADMTPFQLVDSLEFVERSVR